MTIEAHGGALKPRLVSEDEGDGWKGKVAGLPQITLSQKGLADIECLGIGAFSPLEGFAGKDDYEAVVDGMRLASGVVWSIPVSLAIDGDELSRIKGSDQAALVDPEGHPLAVIHIEEVFSYDREREALGVFRTTDPAHPGVAALGAQGDWLVGGKVDVLELPRSRPFGDRRLTPAEMRSEIEARGWRRVVAFQTRNPIHRAHEYLTKCALEIVDGLVLHPLVGETKAGDVPAPTRMRAYEVLLERYYPPSRVILSVFPAAMRYAGPREAIFHALCRKNYGCTHFIVGRDHAGVGNYYGTFDAHEIFSEFSPEEIGITPLFFDHAFWCRACLEMTTTKTCPHTKDNWVILSGTEVRRRLVEGESLPEEFSRPEVAEVLREEFAGSGAAPA